MMEFSTSLVREKIEFTDDRGGKPAAAAVVRSNRIFLRLPSPDGTAVEKVVIRTQTMPTALRFAAKLLFSYYRNGIFTGRLDPYDWERQWEGVLSGYDRAFLPQLWGAVYVNGKAVFKTINSPFVDIVEQCALIAADHYDSALDVTEEMLRKTGHALHISHTSTLAAVFSDTGDETRCGIIRRMDGHDITFSFMAAEGDVSRRIVQSLGIAAAFLEAIDLQRVIQTMQDKIRSGEAAKASPEATRLRAATARMTAIDKAITSFEDSYSVKYRPAKPEFFGRDDSGGL